MANHAYPSDPTKVIAAPEREMPGHWFVVVCSLCDHVSRDFRHEDAAERAAMRHRRSFWHRLAVGEGKSPKAIIRSIGELNEV